VAREIDEGKRREWRERLARYGQSGLTVAAFCAAEEVSIPCFFQWKRRLSRGAAERQSAKGRPMQTDAVEQPKFLPVRIAIAAQVEIELNNGVRVRVPANDAGAIHAAVHAASQLPRGSGEEAATC